MASSDNLDYAFIKESPVNNKLEFGHNEIITTLDNVVSQCTTPFTIGLLGKWGSGKSSISESLRETLKIKNIPVVIFDVWKHEGDALRRTFLKGLIAQLKSERYGKKFFNEKYDLDERVTSVVVEAHDIYKIYKEKLIYHLGLMLLFAFVILLPPFTLFLILYLLFNVNIFSKFGLGSVLASLSGILSASFIFKYLDQFIKTTKVEARKDKYQDPYEFERTFSEILKQLTNRRILIVFDNLDRVSGENAVKIISVIKTFLEPADIENDERDVVFMIPCDIEAIKGHLVKVLKDEVPNGQNSSYYADEFLRKFFNTTIWIPEFYPIELEDFAIRKLRETKIKEFEQDSLAWLITKVFRNNPRQIIQFINILVANYLLLRQKAVVGKFHETNFYQKNVTQLAKYLLLVQKFPAIIDDMKRTRTYFLTESYLNIVREKFGDEFGEFIDETNHVNIDSFEPFFTLKVSEQEQAIPGISRLIFQLEQGNYDKVSIEFTEYKLDKHGKDFNGILRKTLEETNNPLSIVNLINGILLISKNHSFILENNTFQTIQNKLTPSVLRHLDLIPPADITTQFLSKYQNLHKPKKIDIIKKWIDILHEIKESTGNYNSASQDYISAAFSEICFFYKEIPKGEYLLKIRTCATHFFGARWDVYEKIHSHEDLVNTIVAMEWYLKLIDSIPKKPDAEAFDHLESLHRLMYVFSEAIEPTIQKFVDIIENETVNQTQERATELQRLFKLLHKFLTDLLQDTPQPTFSLINLAQKCVVFYKQGRWGSNYVIFPILTQLEKIDATRGIVEAHKLSFLQNLMSVPTEGVQFIIKTDGGFLNNKSYKEHFKEAAKGNTQFFNTFYKQVEEEAQYDWVFTLLENGSIERFSDTLENLEYKIPKTVILADEIINRLNNWPEQYRIQLLLDLDKLDVNAQEINKTAFVSQFYNAIITSPSKNELIDYYKKTKYFSKDDKAVIIEQILGWLKATNQIHFELMTLISESTIILSATIKQDLKQFLFKKLIVEPTNHDLISQGFSIIKPIIEDSDLELINVLKEKIDQSAGIPQVQANLIMGLKGLLTKLKKTHEVDDLTIWLERFGST